MGIIVWIVFGGIVGWVASIVMGTDGQQGIVLNVVVGIVGSVIGGYLAPFVGLGSLDDVSLTSFFIAVAGAMVLLAVVKLARG